MPDSLESIEIRSQEVQEILTKTPNGIIRWGNMVFLLLTLLIFVLTYFIKYPDIIVSEAVITTKIPPQKEYAKITGKMDTILIQDKQHVNKNSLLGVIENTAEYEDVIFLKSIVDTLKVNKHEFVFPLDMIPILFLGEIENSYAAFENNYIKYILNKNLHPFENEIKINEISVVESKRRLKTLHSQSILIKKELHFKKVDLERYRGLFEKGMISEKEFESRQLEYIQAEKSYHNMNASMSQLREAVATTKKVYKDVQITQVREEMMLLKNVIQSFNLLKKAIGDWQNKYAFVSNIDGTVSLFDYWSENQSVNQGDLVFTIIPSQNSSYVVKLKMPSINSGKLKTGQVVNIKLENYPDYEFGVLKGKVSSISDIANKEGYYNVDVSLPQKLITSYGKEIEFKHEMKASAEVITDDLRLIERFLHQFNRLIARN
ncbi:HlyD family secretion protein [Snuella sedimenti]|uniref:HlyD family efflux transporter periplasmic adaptor subunit n=1 Tax=Snuella sedimenti TaxID=2798802 RepID=A0A8J7IUZ1_9FLAO|nr:HlyD family secretion protein [Snuella sedimenti]MBJ6367255.1 HlyD family efflux transporter periplasmic adaptor subunit [Snuella sedimenti]